MKTHDRNPHKRRGGDIMRKASKKSPQSKRKTAAVKDLSVKDAKAVKGGRKAGKPQQDYLNVTLTDVLLP
jgi:hypothetical protein